MEYTVRGAKENITSGIAWKYFDLVQLCTYISWNTICLRPSAWPIYTYAVVCFPDEALVACIMVTLNLVTLLSHFCVAGFLTDVLENAIIAMPAY